MIAESILLIMVNSRDLQVQDHPIGGLKPYPRKHSPRQIRQIAASITEFGFTNPVLIDDAPYR